MFPLRKAGTHQEKMLEATWTTRYKDQRQGTTKERPCCECRGSRRNWTNLWRTRDDDRRKPVVDSGLARVDPHMQSVGADGRCPGACDASATDRGRRRGR